jgi:hypothetical protein
MLYRWETSKPLSCGSMYFSVQPCRDCEKPVVSHKQILSCVMRSGCSHTHTTLLILAWCMLPGKYLHWFNLKLFSEFRRRKKWPFGTETLNSGCIVLLFFPANSLYTTTNSPVLRGWGVFFDWGVSCFVILSFTRASERPNAVDTQRESSAHVQIIHLEKGHVLQGACASVET